jgi:hypothetical protein
MIIQIKNLAKGAHSAKVVLLLVFLAALIAAPVYSFQFDRGDLAGSLDTTLSYGLMWRVQDRDPRLIGTANGGEARSVNFDDGNLNYDKGLVSNVVKATSELGVNYRRTGGFFLRGTAFYDFENMEGTRERTPLTDEAISLVGRRARLLDAFVWGAFDIGTMPAQIRVGDQVVSWGESTFIQNGINVINPIDVSAIRLPGAELREALIPEGMIWASVSPTMNTTFEGFYLYDWEATEIDPPGSYWSTNDFVGAGGRRVMLGFGAVPDTAPFSSGAVVPVGPSRDASDSGQYGLALRLYAPWINDTEFGFYFMNYHSRLPIISGRTGTAAAAAGLDPLGRTYAETALVFEEYPEDIKLYGISFNTLLAGVAIQGETSYRRGVPLQIDDIELIFAALGAIDNLSPGNTPVAPLAAFGQLGLIPFETEIPGYIRRDVIQMQATATNLFGPTLGANQFALLGEVGYTHVRDMPDKNVLRLDGPGTPISGNAPLAGFHFGEVEPFDRFADANSWGYRIAGRLDYNNAIRAATISPRVAWTHDVKGTTPGPGGNFVEGRKAVTVGIGADYQNRWGGDLSYTNFFGAGRYNLVNDRDIITASIRYSF